MSIGTGIVLFVIGAILAFAVNVEVEWINLDLVGYILMGAGVLVFLFVQGLANNDSSFKFTKRLP